MGGGTGTATTTTYTVGTLVVDMYDARTKELAFRGTAQDTLSDKPEKNEKKVEQGRHGERWSYRRSEDYLTLRFGSSETEPRWSYLAQFARGDSARRRRLRGNRPSTSV